MLKSEKPGARAIRALQKANRLKQPSVEGELVTAVNQSKARDVQAEAQELMKPTGQFVTAAGEAAHWPPQEMELNSPRAILFNTLVHPNMISVEASEDRMAAAQRAGVLQAAVDAAETAGA